MKKCNRCKQEKDKTEFSFSSATKDGLSRRCKACQKELSDAHYRGNKEQYRKSHNARRQVKKEAIWKLKEENPCTDCERHYPYYVMQYDHIGTDKLASVAMLVGNSASTEAIMAEIAKCELVCSNCHHIRSHERRVASSLATV